MRLFIVLFLLSNILLAQSRDPFNNLNISEDSIIILETYKNLVDSIKDRMDSVETYLASSEKKIELMALTSDSSDPVMVVEDEWPENTIVSINLLRDQKGNIIYYAEYPFSESGDWFIGYEYYVNEISGNIYGFKRMANFFNSVCVDGVLQEESTYFFDLNFILIGKSYSITDTDGEAIDDVLCFFNYDHEYIIPKNINELVK